MPVLLFGVFAAVFGLLYYVATPQLSLDSPGLLFLVVVSIVIGCGITAISSRERDSSRLPFAVGSAAVVVFVLTLFVSSEFARTSSYYNLLGQEQSMDFMKSLPPLNLANAPLVSHDMAQRAAEKKLSEIPALGSQAQVGDMEKQLVGGKLYWVGFLEHRGIWAWGQRGATPGYVRVSATDPSDVELVTELGGKKLQMRYIQSAYFGDQAERYLRFHGYATTGLEDFSQEIDDEGRPYLVVTVFERRIGLFGADAVGVVTLDVQTGQTRFYPTDEAPKWIDRVQPASFVKEQLGNRLAYVHGWFNPSGQDKLSISGDLDLIYASDGRAHFFAGLGSTAKEGGLVGFVLVDSRTKEVIRYNIAGVTEGVAQAAAEGVYPEKKYKATNALPFLVDGTPAYVMALRDATGIPRSYGIVDILDYQKVAVADTLDATVRLFQTKLNQDRTHSNAAQRADEVRLKAKVVRFATEVRSGTSNYVLMLEGQGNRLFSADVTRAADLSNTQVGDLVELRTLQATQQVQPILEFKNLTLDSLGVPEAKAKPAVSR